MSSFGRVLGVLRNGNQLLRRGPQRITTQKAGGHSAPPYRGYPHVAKTPMILSEVISSAMWFWIFWHMWHDSDAVFGHFPWPDASKWTDEELGVPPDDEE
ncbi:NADH dehydrogenase [ubiquinone] 1 beta subcomplex subunit 2, mitochondrial [Aulostomus maculatus]